MRAGCCLRVVYVGLIFSLVSISTFLKVNGKDDEDICAAFAAETVYAFVESVCDTHK